MGDTYNVIQDQGRKLELRERRLPLTKKVIFRLLFSLFWFSIAVGTILAAAPDFENIIIHQVLVFVCLFVLFGLFPFFVILWPALTGAAQLVRPRSWLFDPAARAVWRNAQPAFGFDQVQSVTVRPTLDKPPTYNLNIHMRGGDALLLEQGRDARAMKVLGTALASTMDVQVVTEDEEQTGSNCQLRNLLKLVVPRDTATSAFIRFGLLLCCFGLWYALVGPLFIFGKLEIFNEEWSWLNFGLTLFVSIFFLVPIWGLYNWISWRNLRHLIKDEIWEFDRKNGFIALNGSIISTFDEIVGIELKSVAYEGVTHTLSLQKREGSDIEIVAEEGDGADVAENARQVAEILRLPITTVRE